MTRPALLGVGGLALGLAMLGLGGIIEWVCLGGGGECRIMGFAGVPLGAVLVVGGLGVYGAVVAWWARLGGATAVIPPVVLGVGGLAIGLVFIGLGFLVVWPDHAPLGCCPYDGTIAIALWVAGLVTLGAVAIGWVWRGEPDS